MFQFVKKLFNKDGQVVDYYIDMMAEKNRLSQLALEIGFNKIADLILMFTQQIVMQSNRNNV